MQANEAIIDPPIKLSEARNSVYTPEKTIYGEQCELEQVLRQDSPKIKSLQVLGSSLCSSRKISAFSIYNPENDHDGDEDQREEPSINSQVKLQDSDADEPILQGKGKKISKDKREQYRLETKNLNRFFRSKINEMLRDIKENPKSQLELLKADELLGRLNESNKIMFSEMRQVIKDEWLQQKLHKCTGMLLRYVHKGKMGMQSKLIMLKYFNKILKAIRNPDKFTCWK